MFSFAFRDELQSLSKLKNNINDNYNNNKMKKKCLLLEVRRIGKNLSKSLLSNALNRIGF